MKPSPRNLLIIPPCSPSTASTIARRNSFNKPTACVGDKCAERAVKERISTNITVISCSVPPSPGSRVNISSAAFRPTCAPNVCRSCSFSRNPVTIRLNSPISAPNSSARRNGTCTSSRPCVTAWAASRNSSTGSATERPIKSAENNANAAPITPTKTPNNCGLVPGDGGAKSNSSSDPIGQTLAETAHMNPRIRSEIGRIPFNRSGRASWKNSGNSPHWVAHSITKKPCVVAINPEIPNEIGRCQNNCAFIGRPVIANETKKAIAPRSQDAPEIAAPYHGR